MYISGIGAMSIKHILSNEGKSWWSINNGLR